MFQRTCSPAWSPFPTRGLGLTPSPATLGLTDGLGEGARDEAKEQPQAVAEQEGQVGDSPGEEGSWETAGPPGQLVSSWLATWKALEVVT